MQDTIRRTAASPLPYILFVLAALPVEPHLGGAFIRPVYLAGALAYLLFLANGPWRLSRLEAPYHATALVLIIYLVLNGFINSNMRASVKEVVEVGIVMGIFWFACRSVRAAGIRAFLRVAGRTFFVFALAYMAAKYAEGDYLSFKDSYWVILFSCIVATMEMRHARGPEAQLRLVLSILILFLSGSRTGWVAYFLFATVAYGIGWRLVLLMAVAGVLLTIVAGYNEQTLLYMASVQILVQALGDLSLNDLHGWLEVAASFENPSDMHRLTEIARAVLVVESNPLFGVGIDRYIHYATDQVTDVETDAVIGSHNELLRILAEGGVFYLGITLMFYLLAVRQARQVTNATFQRTCIALLAASGGMFLFTATNFMITFLLQLSLVLSTAPGVPRNRPPVLREVVAA